MHRSFSLFSRRNFDIRFSRQTFFEELTFDAMFDCMRGNSCEANVRYALLNKKLIPERCLPGRMIMRLSPEAREVVKTATAKDFNHRYF